MGFRRLAPVALAALALAAMAGGASASNDTAFNQQWNLQKIGAPSAWNVSTGTGVTVGVVDSGADAGHPDFGGKVTTYDCTLPGDTCGPAGSGIDENGHGTHVAGIAGARKDNAEGIAGVAPEITVVVAKVFVCENTACENPGASFEDVVTGVNKVLAAGAKVVNLSLGDAGAAGLGFFCNNSDFKNLLNGIWNAGAVPVFAAGNCGGGFLGGSSDFRDVKALVVGATGPDDAVASYSSSLSATKWGLVAPGGGDGSCGAANCILSTWPRSKIGPGQAPYAWLHGTSMAAPHVAGAVAAILARQPDRQKAVEELLLPNLDKISCGAGCQGRLNLAKALGAPVVAATTTTKPASPGPGGTTATTLRRSTSAPRTTAAPRSTTPDLSETELPTTTAVTEDTAVVVDDEFEAAQVPSPTPERPSDEGNGALAVLATLGVLGVGGTAAPLVWRRFLRPG